jgi:hypothetical protein
MFIYLVRLKMFKTAKDDTRDFSSFFSPSQP